MKEAALNETQFTLLLHSVPELGEKSLTRLFTLLAQQRLSPAECLTLTATEWSRQFGLKPEVAAYLVDNRDALIAKSAETLRTLRQHPLEILTLMSAAYPKRLEQFDDAPPPILYALGNFSLLTRTPMRFTFSVAVSNDPPPDALEKQDEIANGLIELGGVPVTGHDRLPYQRLALAAQRRNRPILYVLDRGLREALGPDFDRPPFAAARIREAVFEPERDLALSPFRLDDHGLGANNRRRDRLVFALADVILAVSVRPGGGMAKECLRAKEQGKPVFVVSGRSGSDSLLSAGCTALPTDAQWAEHICNSLTTPD